MKDLFFQKRKLLPDSIWTGVSLCQKQHSNSTILRLTNLIICICFITSIHASDSTELKVWIDIIKESDTAFVKGLAVNHTNEPMDLSWELNIQTETSNGMVSKKMDGTIKSTPNFPIIVAETEIDLKDQAYFEIVLNVFDLKKNRLRTDTLKSTEIDPSLKKRTLPKKVIAKKDLPRPGSSVDAIEIDGLILDETRSKIGRDFYELFYNRWTPPADAKDFLITIKELPARGIGARVSIQVNDNIILYRFLQPRGDLVEQEANISISVVRNYLLRSENIKQDMEAGDQMGSGIY